MRGRDGSLSQTAVAAHGELGRRQKVRLDLDCVQIYKCDRAKCKARDVSRSPAVPGTGVLIYRLSHLGEVSRISLQIGKLDSGFVSSEEV